jgi:hypothetical protein
LHAGSHSSWRVCRTSKGKVNMTPVIAQAPQPMQMGMPAAAPRPAPGQPAAVVTAANPVAGGSFEVEGSTSAAATVGEFLASIGLPASYEASLAELGAADLAHLVDLVEEDLTAIGMKPLEAKRFVRSTVSSELTLKLVTD